MQASPRYFYDAYMPRTHISFSRIRCLILGIALNAFVFIWRLTEPAERKASVFMHAGIGIPHIFFCSMWKYHRMSGVCNDYFLLPVRL